MQRQAVEELVKLVRAEVAGLAMSETGRSWLKVVAAGNARELLEGYRIKAHEVNGLLEAALYSGQTVSSEDFNSLDEGGNSPLDRLGRGIAVPLRRQGQVAGVLAVFRPGQGFRPEEYAILELFAELAGPLLAAAVKVNELETALKSRDEFLSIASHDLRNPLTALRGFSQLTLRAINRYPEGQLIPRENLLNNLQRIIKQTNSLDKLIGKLLDVSRINTGRLEIQPEPADLAELVNESARRSMIAITTAEMEEGVAVENRHTLRLLIGEEPMPGLFDRERIDQVVTNLIDNAMKYSPDGGDITISLVKPDPHSAELRVSDQGIGIPEEKQALIFNRWSRVHNPRESEATAPGLGLGLFICREIVRKHGGQIGLESEPGKGSVFIVTLPLRS